MLLIIHNINKVGRIMNINIYFKTIKDKINRIDKYVTNPINFKDINNPFSSTITKTYVWLENDKNKDC